MLRVSVFVACLLQTWLLMDASSSSAAFVAHGIAFRKNQVRIFAEESIADNGDDTQDDISGETVIKIDDGGSDLTNRFKYKVSKVLCKHLR